MERGTRPLGVTIVSVLAGLIGIVLIAIGLLVLIVPLIGGVGIAGVVIGLIWFGLGWGLYTGKGWAWIITVILAIISIIFDIIGVISQHSEHILPLIIAAVILYYLFRPNVKAYFGRGLGTKISK
jgi:hypothetical protein